VLPRLLYCTRGETRWLNFWITTGKQELGKSKDFHSPSLDPQWTYSLPPVNPFAFKEIATLSKLGVSLLLGTIPAPSTVKE